jgi:hypothetical protein
LSGKNNPQKWEFSANGGLFTAKYNYSPLQQRVTEESFSLLRSKNWLVKFGLSLKLTFDRDA